MTSPRRPPSARRISAADIDALSPERQLALQRLVGGVDGFQVLYRRDLDRFVREIFTWPPGEGPTPYQRDILRHVPLGRVCVRAPHGVGKTTLAAWAILWFALTRDGLDWKVIVTASVWRQLKTFLWPEVKKWVARLRWDRIGRPPLTAQEWQYMTLKLRTGAVTTVASNTPAYIEGAHADHLLYVFDEAKAITDETFDAAEGAFSGGHAPGREALALAISTPGAPVGRFYRIHTKNAGFDNWWTRAIRLEEAVAAGRVSAQWAAEARALWGDTSPIYRNRVLGDFAEDHTDGVIPLAWVEAAMARWDSIAPRGERRVRATAIGVDIAAGGVDRNVYAVLMDTESLSIVTEVRRKPYSQNTRVTLAEVRGLADVTGRPPIVIDAIGLGSPLVDELREACYDVRAFDASAGTTASDRSGEMRFANLRAAAWWTLRERLDPNSRHPPVVLPPDDHLIGDLTAPRWERRTHGLIIESKKDIRKRLGRSTDVGDAIVHAFALNLLTPKTIEVPVSRWG
jgi:hypothetical protein